MYIWLLVLVLVFGMGGIGYALGSIRSSASFLGAILPAWGYHLHSDYGTVGLYFLFLTFGLYAGSQACHWLVARTGLRELLPSCLAVFVLTPALATITPAPQEFRQEIAGHHQPAGNAPTGAVDAITLSATEVPIARSNGGWLELVDGTWRPASAPSVDTLTALPDGSTVRQLTRSPQGERHAATTTGLWVEKGGR